MKKILFILGVFTIFYYLPIISNPALFLNRGNDLQEFFWPIYYFAKNQIINHNTFPLWNNLFLSGTPLLPDPQSPLFYFPNIIFLLLPLGAAFILSSILHVFVGGVGTYITARKGFGYSSFASTLTALFYISSPKLAGFIEAGHFGLIESMAWLPFVLLATIKIAKSPNVNWSLMLAVSMAGLFYTHSVTFFISAFTSLFIFLFLGITREKRILIEKSKYYLLSATLAFGLTAITLLPQIQWQGLTTRSLLINKPQIFPVWTSKLEFIKSFFIPWMNDGGIFGTNTEKWFPMGIFASALAFGGFLKVNKKTKVVILFSSILTALIALGNTSPIHSLLIKQEWYVMMRVPTRVWFIFFFIVIYLAGYFINELEKKKLNKRTLILISSLVVIEFTTLSWIFLSKPYSTRAVVPSETYDLLESDTDKFRVLCLSRCLMQDESARRGLELVEGYSTLTQLNYYQASFQLTGGYWDYYSLSTPPAGVYKFENLQPDAKSAAEYNIKYIISPHELEDKTLVLDKRIGDYFVYLNPIFKPRANGPILFYSPNRIRVDSSNLESTSVILAEVYSPGWKAYLNGKEEVRVQETPISLRAVDIKPDTEFVDFVYLPKSYEIGRVITVGTVLGLTIVFFKNKWGR